jgi:arylsulfatase
MELSIDGRRADAIAVDGMLPFALQHGGAGLRLGYDSGFPVSPRYFPPARFSGTVHSVKIETLGAAVTSSGEEVRTALHGD